jgi:hypothetical protein
MDDDLKRERLLKHLQDVILMLNDLGMIVKLKRVDRVGDDYHFDVEDMFLEEC